MDGILTIDGVIPKQYHTTYRLLIITIRKIYLVLYEQVYYVYISPVFSCRVTNLVVYISENPIFCNITTMYY